MRKRIRWIKSLTFFLILILVLNYLFVTIAALNNGSNQDTNNKPLNIFYLSKSQYLLPYPPGDEATNKTELSTSQGLVFTHNIRDRKFNTELMPELDIWLNANGKAGLTLTLELGFQAWEQDTLIEGKFYRILFKNYTTSGLSGIENAKITFDKYVGEPFDISYGSDFAAFYLLVNLTDNTSKPRTVEIYCGAGDKTSYIKLPYDKTLSSTEDKENKDDQSSTCFSWLILITVPTITLTIYLKNKNIHNKKRNQ
jgi:hypothetical protein